MRRLQNALLTATAITIGLSLAGCTTPDLLRKETAKRIAGPAWMIERQIPAGQFSLTLFERMHERSAPANIYIGDDGNAIRTDYFKSRNPTPENPVALHLAALDKSDNVVYIARPCQYSELVSKDDDCEKTYWNDKSFSSEVLTAYNGVLDDIRDRYGIAEFNLIGHSGGGAIAAILAAQRDDVSSLRTVAGNLDHKAQSDYHGLPIWTGSLNAIDYAADLKDIPQMHYIGGQDENVPPAILHNYLQAIGDNQCVKYDLIQEAEHQRGWADKWPELLKQNPPVCAKRIPTFEPLNIPEPIYSPRFDPSK